MAKQNGTASGLLRIPRRIVRSLRAAKATLKGYPVVVPEAYFRSAPRYGHGKPAHPGLAKILNARREHYVHTLRQFLRLTDDFITIPVATAEGPDEPYWNNDWFSGLDAVALYGFLCDRKPERLIEIGSGHSTRFIRYAIRRRSLKTWTTSIGPSPRAAIDNLCDAVIRERLEDTDLSVFDRLDGNDIVFIDSSHRCLMNSDVTVIFLDILPRLPAGTLVHFHDIFLPYDYAPEWTHYQYSEQYLLAACLLANTSRYEVVLPNWFITQDPELSRVLYPLWNEPDLAKASRGGVSFWIRIR